MKKILISAITIALITPQIALASWWNPFSWFKKQVAPQPQQTQVVVNTNNQETTTKAITETQPSPKKTNEKVTTVSSPTPSIIFYPVVKVVDGDTLSVNINGTATTLRLIGINTPETVDPRKDVECFGKEASNKAKELLSGKKVRVVTDASQGTLDKYQRTLAYVFLEDGTNFNEIMIKEGYAYEYTYNTPYQYQKEFKLAQSEAQKFKKGLWADGACGIKNVTTSVTTTPTQPSTATVEQPKIETPPVIIPIQAIPVAQTQIAPNNSKYICSQNAYNCTDFSTHAEAQTVYESCGGISNDIHRLDNDKDGEACETLP